MMKRYVTLGKNTWRFSLSNVNEFSFELVQIIKPKLDIFDIQFSKWNEEDTHLDPHEEYESVKTGFNVSIFLFKKIVFKNIVSMICISKVDNFFFRPTTKLRHTIYSRLCDQLKEELIGEWQYQIVGNYFYFNKI